MFALTDLRGVFLYGVSIIAFTFSSSSFYSHHGSTLINSTFKWLVAENLGDCNLKCFDEEGCMSINYDRENKKCELNNSTKETHSTRLVRHARSIYATIKSPPVFPECKNYKLLSDASRHKSFYQDQQLCDWNLVPGWYRFGGEAGTMMMNECLPKYDRCGGGYLGWMDGTLPLYAHGIVKRIACFYHAGNCCHWMVNIRVRNCGFFYVYELKKPPVCYLRYCGE
ncbi:pancreatic secretory granule membrane major glycoprotein GP2-like [Nematostella vectensis]|uniref:pancreatic secretory granule membrane major glycoprotein GP2-like n=1 Tax=Nematostella vectensis TaxID=45351 RepID=UPI00207750FE|nr:pancreatic secretory granule membrane major glycoprotein GP2-like [Nematostella vectensis]